MYVKILAKNTHQKMVWLDEGEMKGGVVTPFRTFCALWGKKNFYPRFLEINRDSVRSDFLFSFASLLTSLITLGEGGTLLERSYCKGVQKVKYHLIFPEILVEFWWGLNITKNSTKFQAKSDGNATYLRPRGYKVRSQGPHST